MIRLNWLLQHDGKDYQTGETLTLAPELEAHLVGNKTASYAVLPPPPEVQPVEPETPPPPVAEPVAKPKRRKR